MPQHDGDTDLQRGVAEIVRRVLRCGEVRGDASFADLGGSSLGAVHVVSLIEERYGVAVPLEEFLDAPDIASVAAAVARRGAAPRAT